MWLLSYEILQLLSVPRYALAALEAQRITIHVERIMLPIALFTVTH